MKTEFFNKLNCESNPMLMSNIDPQEIIKNFSAELINSENGEYLLKSLDSPLIEEAKQIAKQYPNEEFVLMYWDDDDYNSRLTTIKLNGEESIVVKVEPNFQFDIPSYLENVVGKEFLYGGLKSIALNLTMFDYRFPYKGDNKENFDINEVSSKAGFGVSNEEYRITGTRLSYSYVNVDGYYKDNLDGSWKLIDENYNPQITSEE